MAISAIAASAVVLAFAAGARAAAPADPKNLATIYNPGNGDYVGFRIDVERTGNVTAVDAAGHAARLLRPDVIDRFFSDLSAGIPIANLPYRSCTADAGLETTTVDLNQAIAILWNGRRYANLRCVTDERAATLLADAAAIQRALYVQVYRERVIARFSGGGAYGSDSPSQGGYVSGPYSPSAYRNGGTPSGGYTFGGLNLGGLSMGGFGSGLPTSGISGGLPGGSISGTAPSGSMPGGNPYGGSPFNGSPYSH